MSEFRTIALVALILIATQSISVLAQTSSTSQPATIALSLMPEKKQVSLDQKPWVILTVKNITNHKICISTGNPYRVHVEKLDYGELPKTEFHRHLRREFSPGDGPDLSSGPVVCPDVAAGASDIQKYDLSAYYNFSVPGKYTVYLEFQDESSQAWLRTNTARFEMQAPTQ